jgi:hypothetical protein
VATEEEQRELVVLGPVVLSRAWGDGRVRGLQRDHRLLAPPAGALAAELVDEPPRRDGDEPAARVLRHADERPARRRGDERLLHGVLGQVEAAVAAHERAEHLGASARSRSSTRSGRLTRPRPRGP